MSDALELRTLDEAQTLAKTLSLSSLLPQALRQRPADVLAIVLAGKELGLQPMQALRGIQIIQGKPTLSADTMGALVKSRGDICEFLVLKESTAEKATYETKRRGDPQATTLSFTIAEARGAGLGGDNWKKYPAAMLRARALSAICRAVYPDLLLGVYDPEELTSPQPERDVTPQHVYTSTTAPALSEKLTEALAPRPSPPAEAEVVEAPKARRMEVRDVEPQPTPPPSKAPTPYDNLLALAKLEEIPWQKALAWVRHSRGKAKKSDITQADVDAYREALNEEARMEEAAKDAAEQQGDIPF